MRRRHGEYARVMLTSYPHKHWDVGDAYGADWMDKAIRIGRTAKNVVEAAKTLPPVESFKTPVFLEKEPETEKKANKSLVYVAWGLGFTFLALTTYAFVKSRGSK